MSALIFLCLFSTAAVCQEPVLDQQNITQWREHILPSEGDLNWQKIPWLTSYGDGVSAANDADKPLLLWVMNGHPLGCT